jgi:hypothetical protein
MKSFSTSKNEESKDDTFPPKNRILKKEKMALKEYFQLGEVFGYFFRKKDPSRPSTFNLRMMHGINKISIIMFLLGVIFLVVKRLL